jgi:hypothetical protein
LTVREARYVTKALTLWPRLDPAKLRRTGGDPTRISRLVARRTALPELAILELILNEREATRPRG